MLAWVAPCVALRELMSRALGSSAARAMKYSREAHLSQLIGVVLEYADTARVTKTPLFPVIKLNPSTMGYPKSMEMNVTADDEPYLPRILEWAAAATAAIEQNLAKLKVLVRGPLDFPTNCKGLDPGPPGSGTQCVAVLQKLQFDTGRSKTKTSVDLRNAVLDTAPEGKWWAGLTEEARTKQT